MHRVGVRDRLPASDDVSGSYPLVAVWVTSS